MNKYKEYLHPWIWISSVVWRTIFIFVFWTATLEHFHEYFLWPRRGSSLALETLLSTLACCRQSSQQLFGYLRQENQLFCSSSVPGTTLLDRGQEAMSTCTGKLSFRQFILYEKQRLPNMNKSFIHIEKRVWPRIWPRRFSALNPSPRSWIFTSVSVDSSPRSYSPRSRVLARLASLAQIGELARRLQKSRRNHHCHVWYGMVFVLAQELSVIASVDIASFLSRPSKQTERVFQIGVFLKRRPVVFVWMDVENGGLRIYDHDVIQHTAHAL